MKKTIQQPIEERKEVEGTNGRYKVSTLGRAEGPLGLLNEKIGADGKKRIKHILGYPQITISYQDENGVITERKDKLVHTLIADAFPEQIENYNIKEGFTNPRITHKDGIRTNNITKNLKRIDYNPLANTKTGIGEGNVLYHEEQKDIIAMLKLNHTLKNNYLAKVIFGKGYIPQQHDQFVYRERKKLESQNLIPVSKANKANKNSSENRDKILELLNEGKLKQKQIAEQLGVTETTVSRIKNKNIQNNLS